LIAEGLNALVELIQRGNAPEEMREVGLFETHYAIGGKVFEKPIPLYRRTTYSLDDLVRVADDAINSSDDDVTVAEPAIWVSPTGVRLLPCGADKRQWVWFPLRYSKAWDTLMACAEEIKLMEQRAFVRMLAYTLEAEPALVTPWRRLDFTTTARASGDTQFAKDRLGREINSEAAGVGELPKELMLEVPIFREMGERERVRIVAKVEIDAGAGRLALVPKESDLALAVEVHLTGIKQRLTDELPNVGVYLGEV